MRFRFFLNVVLIVLVTFLVIRGAMRGDRELPHFTLPVSGKEAAASSPEAKPQQTATLEAPASAVIVLPKPEAEAFATAVHYTVELSGFPVANIYVGLQSREDATELHAIIKSLGIADVAGGYKTDTTTVARFVPERNGYMPRSYHTQFKLKGDWRTIKLDYAEDGSIAQPEFDTPPEKRWKRKEVPPEMKTGSFDPLTAALAARQKIKELVGQGKVESGARFTLPLYDGRRRTDLAFTLQGIHKDGNIALNFREVPVAGYTENELESFKENDHTVHLLVSPKTFLPVQAQGFSVLGTAEARLVKQCATLEKCVE